MDQLQQVADGCHAWVRAGGWGEANALLVTAPEGSEALLVDTPWDVHVTRELLDRIATHTRGAGLTHVVNTHADGDHWWGNAALPPETTILTSAAAAAQMRAEPGPQQIRALTAAARATGRLPGRLGRASRYLAGMFDGVRMPVRTRLPDITFDDRLTVQVGGRRIELADEGPAHTAGDVVVTVPDAGVVATGDLLFAGSTPILWHGPLEQWTTALDRIIAVEPDVVVPGHGPLAGLDDVREMRRYWDWVQTAGRDHFDAGHDSLHSARSMLASPDARPWLAWQHPDRLAISTSVLWRLWSGSRPHPPTTAERMAAFADAEHLRDRR